MGYKETGSHFHLYIYMFNPPTRGIYGRAIQNVFGTNLVLTGSEDGFISLIDLLQGKLLRN